MDYNVTGYKSYSPLNTDNYREFLHICKKLLRNYQQLKNLPKNRNCGLKKENDQVTLYVPD